MNYMVGALVALNIGLIYYIYKQSILQRKENLARKEIQSKLEKKEDEIIKSYDDKIDKLNPKELNSNEAVLGYLNDSTNGSR